MSEQKYEFFREPDRDMKTLPPIYRGIINIPSHNPVADLASEVNNSISQMQYDLDEAVAQINYLTKKLEHISQFYEKLVE